MAEKKEKQYEDENGYYIWRTVRGKPVKIYKEKSIYESIVMSNLQKSLQKEIEATKIRNAEYVAEKVKKAGFVFSNGNNIAGLTNNKAQTNVDLLNKGADKLIDMSNKFPLRCVKPSVFRVDWTQYLGYVSYNYRGYEEQNMTVSRFKYSKQEKEIISESGWAHHWSFISCYDKEADDLVDCPSPSNKMNCSDEDIPIYTFIHEYGHLLEHDIFIERIRKTVPEFGKASAGLDSDSVKKMIQSQSRKIKNEIIKIFKTDKGLIEEYGKAYEWKHYMSFYGQSKPEEFFAELFAGSYLAQDNRYGNDNRLIKAFRIWLKKERG